MRRRGAGERQEEGRSKREAGRSREEQEGGRRTFSEKVEVVPMGELEAVFHRNSDSAVIWNVSAS